jgi:alpha-glucosidase (family GH31 glycosyl hydrolase)
LKGTIRLHLLLLTHARHTRAHLPTSPPAARFPAAKMRAFVDQLHADGLQWVPIHDAAIAKRGGYKAYEEGSRDDVWIKDMRGETYVGQVWPGEAVYPDYLAAANVSSWLQAQLQAFYDQAPFDGLWLDMNEASNFCSGVNCKPDTADKAKMMCEWRAAAAPAPCCCLPGSPCMHDSIPPVLVLACHHVFKQFNSATRLLLSNDVVVQGCARRRHRTMRSHVSMHGTCLAPSILS